MASGNFFLHPLRVLVGKIETTPGTLETLTGSDFDVRIRNPEISVTVEMDDEASKWARGDHGEDDVITGSQSAQVTFSVRMTKGATVATVPNWWKFANGCGALTVSYAAAGRALQPRKQYDENTMTLYIYDVQRGGTTPAAVLYKIAGAVGNMTFTAAGVGKPWAANFTFTGKVVDIDMNITNANILQVITAETVCGEKFLNNDCWLGTNEEKISQFSFDCGNEIQPVLDQSDLTGYAYYGITSRKPRLSVNPLMISSHDVWNEVAQGVTGCPGTMAVMIGDTGLSRYSLHIPKGQILNPGLANREGLVNWDLNIKCLANGVTGSVASGDLQPEVSFELLLGKRS